MEKKTKFYRTISFVALITLVLLLVPFVAMQVTPDVRWDLVDFVLAGTLIFVAGSVLAVVLQSHTSVTYRAGVIIAIGTTFLMIVANLAVGLIGSGPNAGNLMYGGVLAVLLAGLYLSKFKPVGMERTMFATALSVLLAGGIAIMLGEHQLPGSSVIKVVGVSLFFSLPYGVAGLLFRVDSTDQASVH
jgi:hypothetical protein